MHRCPTCGEFADRKTHPFCSSRCADVDLSRWFRGNYAIPALDSADDTIAEAQLVDNSLGSQDADEH